MLKYAPRGLRRAAAAHPHMAAAPPTVRSCDCTGRAQTRSVPVLDVAKATCSARSDGATSGAGWEAVPTAIGASAFCARPASALLRVSSHAKLVFEQRGVKKGGVALDMLSTHSCIHLFRLHGAIFRLFRISYLATKYPTIITFANFRDICNGPNMRLASGMTHSATPNHKTGGLSLRSLSDV